MKHLRYILFLIWLLPSLVAAQEMTVQAPQEVYEGDNFTVRFSVNDRVSDFQAPSFKGFSLLAGPMQSSQSSFSIRNGQHTHSVSTSVSYTLRADGGLGSYTIGAASCTVDGKKVSSQPFIIKVVKLNAQQQQQRQQQAQQQQQRRQQFDPWSNSGREPSKLDGKSLFARASVSKTNPYQGEQVIITYKIYTRVPIRQYAIDKLPGNRGFWAEDLSVGQQVKKSEETVDGVPYAVYEIRRGAMFAQESGDLSIAPLDLNVEAIVQQQRRQPQSIWDLFDDSFFNPAQAVEYPLSTQKLSLHVRPLPGGAPAGFGGAVGRFEVKGGASLDRVKANEAVSYKITVSGSGNLMLQSAPQPRFPSVFEVYDPQITDNLQRSDNGVSGSRTFEWVLIPRSQGDYTIPAFDFVFFDPSTGQYVTRRVAEQHIHVDKGDGRGSSVASVAADAPSDICGLVPVGKLHPVRSESHAGFGFWLVAALVLLAAVALVLFVRKRERDEMDVAGMRQKRAVREARKRLKKAAAFLGPGDTARFYEEIYKAIWGVLADKYNIELSQLNRDTVSACLQEKQVDAARQAQVMKVLQDVDMARFAPGDPTAQKQSVYSEALNMIASL